MAVFGDEPRDEGPPFARAGPSGRQRGSGRILGEDPLELDDEPERVVVTALEDVAAEDQPGGAGFPARAAALRARLADDRG
jgi:hypothetical protein